MSIESNVKQFVYWFCGHNINNINDNNNNYLSKGLDENGNSLHQTATTTTTQSASDTNAKKKSKKSKVDRNVSVLYAKDIAGHQDIQDIDQLVKYIEENDTSTTSTKKHIIDVMKKPKRIKTKSETSTPKSNLKKSNSLEEISKTKFADLMNSDGAKRARVKKQSTSEDGDRNTILLNDVVHCKEEVRDRRSWGTEDSQQYMMSKYQRDVSFSGSGNGTPDPQLVHLINQETADFHVVTKKKKSKKRTTNMTNNHHGNKGDGHRTGGAETKQTNSHGRSYHRNAFAAGENSVPTRRKSACSVPPSDKSGESSDVDSVHSLPAATTRKQNTNNNNNSSKTIDDDKTTSGASTATNEYNETIAALVSPPGSNTSYADIAKNNNLFNIANNVQQSHPQQQQQQKSSSIALKSSEHFPELLCTLETTTTTTISDETNKSSPANNNKQLMCVVNKTSSSSSSSSTSDVVVRPKINNNVRRTTTTTTTTTSNRSRVQHQRPAVIILNDCPNKDDLSFVQQSPSEPIQVSGLTFGFELNEQLLNDDEPLQQQQQHQQQLNNNFNINNTNNNFCARFLAPPSDVKDNYNHDKIVQFIGMAWEELIHDNKGKIQYYNGQ